MYTYQRFKAAAPFLLLCAAGSAATAPARVPTDASPRVAGLAVLEGVSLARVDPDKPAGDVRVRFRVLRVIEQPPGGPEVRADATLDKTTQGDWRGRRYMPLSLPPNLVYLARIYWDKGALSAGLRTAITIPVSEGAAARRRVADYEANAFQSDVLKLRSARTPSAKAAAFAKTARSSTAPSGALLMAMEELCWTELSPWGVPLYEDRLERHPPIPDSLDARPRTLNDADRVLIGQGMATLAVRADAPDYVRFRALRTLRQLPKPLDRAKREAATSAAVAKLIDAYGQSVRDEKSDLVYGDIVLSVLANFFDNEGWLPSSRNVGERLAQLREDITIHRQRLLNKAGPDLNDKVREAIEATGKRLFDAISDDAGEKR